MTYYWMALYLILILFFDSVFLVQYLERVKIKQELMYSTSLNWNDPKKLCCSLFVPLLNGLFSIIQTQISFINIFSNICFVVIVFYENLKLDMGISLTSLIITVLPKLYSYSLTILLIFSCIREEDRRRKMAYLSLLLNDFRMQALNIEYIYLNKQKFIIRNALYNLVV